MTQIKRHPLYHTADLLKRAFVLNGFHLLDESTAPTELLSAEEANVPVFSMPGELSCEKILLGDGSYTLRGELLGSRLHTLGGRLPISVIACGRVYDRRDADYPSRLYLEGIYAADGASFRDYVTLWEKAAAEAFGIGTALELQAEGKDAYRIVVRPGGGEDGFTLGYTGQAGWTARALLGLAGSSAPAWVFAVNVDDVAIHLHGLHGRAALYDPRVSFLDQFNGAEPAFGGSFADKAADLLRKRGFLEFSGMKIYEEDCYRKMNMIQESWDTNNQGVQLQEPLGKMTALPTVLTPGLEEALSANYRAGETDVRIFEIGSFFHPGKDGKRPMESLFLSIGMYGPEVDKVSFKQEIDTFLTELGIRNHFFIPTTMAIAYDTSDCWLVLDEKPDYLGGNFGGISPIAEKNHGIGTHAFMAQLELEPLRKKAAAEYSFIPNELK